jgi:hypothetical protein
MADNVLFIGWNRTGVSEINLAPRPEASIGGPFGNLHA